MSERNPKYLDEDEDILRKDVVYACEHSLREIDPEDDEDTKTLLMHETMFNQLSVNRYANRNKNRN